MDLQPYVDAVRHELAVAPAAGGQDAEALAERLTAPLESAIRLALLEALSEAAEQITRDLAPGSVEVRLRGRDAEFTVSAGTEAVAELSYTPPAAPLSFRVGLASLEHRSQMGPFSSSLRDSRFFASGFILF